MDSIWTKTVNLPHFPVLKGDKKTDVLIIGGGSHRTGKPEGGCQEIRNFAGEVYPFAKEKACWATQDCMSLDQIPYIGAYAKGVPNAYVATGFNKWGMTSSMAAAKLLCDLVQERQNPYADLFSPQRSGSRFDDKGGLIDGPAMGDLK